MNSCPEGDLYLFFVDHMHPAQRYTRSGYRYFMDCEGEEIESAQPQLKNVGMLLKKSLSRHFADDIKCVKGTSTWYFTGTCMSIYYL